MNGRTRTPAPERFHQLAQEREVSLVPHAAAAPALGTRGSVRAWMPVTSSARCSARITTWRCCVTTLVAEADELGGRGSSTRWSSSSTGGESSSKPARSCSASVSFAEKATQIGRRFARYWSVWLEEQRCHRATDDEPLAASV